MFLSDGCGRRWRFLPFRDIIAPSKRNISGCTVNLVFKTACEYAPAGGDDYQCLRPVSLAQLRPAEANEGILPPLAERRDVRGIPVRPVDHGSQLLELEAARRPRRIPDQIRGAGRAQPLGYLQRCHCVSHRKNRSGIGGRGARRKLVLAGGRV